MLGCVFQLLVYFYKIQYDDSGVRSLFFWTAQVFGILFWLVNELIFLLHNGKAIPFQFAISVSASIGLGFSLDRLIQCRHRNANSTKTNSTKTKR